MSVAASRIAVASSIGALLLAAPTAYALCMAPQPRPRQFLASADHVPRGAGIVVDVGDVSAAMVPRLVREQSRGVALALEPIGAGLTLVRVPADVPTGRATLEGVLATAVTIDVTAEAVPPPLAAPRIASLRRSDTPGPGRGTSSAFEAILEGAPPPGATALVATWGTTQTWALAETATTVVLAYSGRCSGRGQLASVGDTVTLFWIDRFGQRSAPTRPIAVRAPSPRPPR